MADIVGAKKIEANILECKTVSESLGWQKIRLGLSLYGESAELT